MGQISNFVSILKSHLLYYPTPVNLPYIFSLGSVLGIMLGVQIVTGVLLSMHYVPHVDLAFDSVERIMRDVSMGWFMRYMHSNGSSMIFILMYGHIAKGIYYHSFQTPRQWVGCTGVVLFILMSAIAFLGYTLPGGQMSYGGATVITNIITAIPLFGKYVINGVGGGFSVNTYTLSRFFTLHYLLSFLAAGLSILHIILLHEVGSTVVDSRQNGVEFVPFYPYYFYKDLFAFLIFLVFYLFIVFYAPNLFGHPDNYIPASIISTPAHIVPEGYFLPFYAMLKSIPSKLGGALCMVVSMVILLILPGTTNNGFDINDPQFKPFFEVFYMCFVFTMLMLGGLGGQAVTDLVIQLGQFFTVCYFGYIVVITGLLSEMSLRFAMGKASLDSTIGSVSHFSIIALAIFGQAEWTFYVTPSIVVSVLFMLLFVVVSNFFRPIVRVMCLLAASIMMVVIWSVKFGLTFIFLSYILVFISAVLMLFLSIVLMLPALEISYRHDVFVGLFILLDFNDFFKKLWSNILDGGFNTPPLYWFYWFAIFLPSMYVLCRLFGYRSATSAILDLIKRWDISLYNHINSALLVMSGTFLYVLPANSFITFVSDSTTGSGRGMHDYWISPALSGTRDGIGGINGGMITEETNLLLGGSIYGKLSSGNLDDIRVCLFDKYALLMLVSISLLLLVLILIGIIKDSGFLCSDELGLRGFGLYTYVGSSLPQEFNMEKVLGSTIFKKGVQLLVLPAMCIGLGYVLEVIQAETWISSFDSTTRHLEYPQYKPLSSSLGDCFIDTQQSLSYVDRQGLLPVEFYSDDYSIGDRVAIILEALLVGCLIVGALNWAYLGSAFKFRIGDSNLTLFDTDKRFNPLIGTPLGSDLAGLLVNQTDVRSKKTIGRDKGRDFWARFEPEKVTLKREASGMDIPSYGKQPENYYTGDYRWPLLHNKKYFRRGSGQSNRSKFVRAQDLGRNTFGFERRIKRMLETQPEYQTDYDYVIFRFGNSHPVIKYGLQIIIFAALRWFFYEPNYSTSSSFTYVDPVYEIAGAYSSFGKNRAESDAFVAVEHPFYWFYKAMVSSFRYGFESVYSRGERSEINSSLSGMERSLTSVTGFGFFGGGQQSMSDLILKNEFKRFVPVVNGFGYDYMFSPLVSFREVSDEFFYGGFRSAFKPGAGLYDFGDLALNECSLNFTGANRLKDRLLTDLKQSYEILSPRYVFGKDELVTHDLQQYFGMGGPDDFIEDETVRVYRTFKYRFGNSKIVTRSFLDAGLSRVEYTLRIHKEYVEVFYHSKDNDKIIDKVELYKNRLWSLRNFRGIRKAGYNIEEPTSSLTADRGLLYRRYVPQDDHIDLSVVKGIYYLVERADTRIDMENDYIHFSNVELLDMTSGQFKPISQADISNIANDVFIKKEEDAKIPAVFSDESKTTNLRKISLTSIYSPWRVESVSSGDGHLINSGDKAASDFFYQKHGIVADNLIDIVARVLAYISSGLEMIKGSAIFPLVYSVYSLFIVIIGAILNAIIGCILFTIACFAKLCAFFANLGDNTVDVLQAVVRRFGDAGLVYIPYALLRKQELWHLFNLYSDYWNLEEASDSMPDHKSKDVGILDYDVKSSFMERDLIGLDHYGELETSDRLKLIYDFVIKKKFHKELSYTGLSKKFQEVGSAAAYNDLLIELNEEGGYGRVRLSTPFINQLMVDWISYLRSGSPFSEYNGPGTSNFFIKSDLLGVNVREFDRFSIEIITSYDRLGSPNATVSMAEVLQGSSEWYSSIMGPDALNSRLATLRAFKSARGVDGAYERRAFSRVHDEKMEYSKSDLIFHGWNGAGRQLVFDKFKLGLHVELVAKNKTYFDKFLRQQSYNNFGLHFRYPSYFTTTANNSYRAYSAGMELTVPEAMPVRSVTTNIGDDGLSRYRFVNLYGLLNSRLGQDWADQMTDVDIMKMYGAKIKRAVNENIKDDFTDLIGTKDMVPIYRLGMLDPWDLYKKI